MNPNLYPESAFPVPQQTATTTTGVNQAQRDIDRIIVHDEKGHPIKREQGAIYKGDIANQATATGTTNVDPYLPGYQPIVSTGGLTGVPVEPIITTTTTTQEPFIVGPLGTEGVEDVEETTEPGQKVGFFQKIRNWRDKRKQRKAEKKAGEKSASSSSPSPERERDLEGTGIGTTGKTLVEPTGTTLTDTRLVPPIYQTQSGIPVRDTTKDYSRNLGLEVPITTQETLGEKVKDVAKTGTWNYGDQRIQRIEQTFPQQTVQTQPQVITTQPEVITTQPQVITTQPQVPLIGTQQQFQQEPVSRVINYTPTAQTLAQWQQNESLPVSQGLTNQQPLYTGAQQLGQPGISSIPVTQGMNMQTPMTTGFPSGATTFPTDQLGVLPSSMERLNVGPGFSNMQQQGMTSDPAINLPYRTDYAPSQTGTTGSSIPLTSVTGTTAGQPNMFSGTGMTQPMTGTRFEQPNMFSGTGQTQPLTGTTLEQPYMSSGTGLTQPLTETSFGQPNMSSGTGLTQPLTETSFGQPNMSSGTGLTQPLTGTTTGSSWGQTIFPPGQGTSNLGPRASPTNIYGQPQGGNLTKRMEQDVEQDIAAKRNQPKTL